MMPKDTESKDFRAYLRMVWRWKLLVLGLLIVVPAVSYALEARKQPLYESSTLVRAEAAAIDPSLFPSATSGSEDLFMVARLVQTRTIADAAGKLLSPPEPGSAISGLISVSPDIETGFLTISAAAPEPRRSADVATAVASAISANRTAQQIGQINAAINQLLRQRASTPPRDVQRSQLNAQIQKLRAARGALKPNQAVVESAIPSATPVGRNTRRAVQLGLVIALLLSAGAVALAEGSDRRLRSPDDLEDLTGLPLLSAIPVSAFSSEVGEEQDEEAFQMLRAALTYFNVDRRLASVVIASPGQEDGKTTVAIRLAYAMARAGGRVILVDADLRQPRIGGRLGLKLADGLGSVIVGTRQLSDTLVDLPIRSPDAPQGQGSLKLLPAGTAAPNSAELLSSPGLLRVLHELESSSDIVIIDSAAALAVSDTLPLLQAASGVVLIARLNRSTRAGIRRLQQVITAASGTVLGVVATGASPRGGYQYGYGYALPREPRASRRTKRKDGKDSKQPQDDVETSSEAPPSVTSTRSALDS